MGVKILAVFLTLVIATSYFTGNSYTPNASNEGATGTTGVEATTLAYPAQGYLPVRPTQEPTLTKVGTKTVTRLNLSANEVVYITGVIMENAEGIVAELKEKAKHNKTVWLLIDSPGGSVIDGAAIVSAMEASPAKINTVCLSVCASMAFIIHQYGNKRYALDRSILMAHPASGAVQGTMEQMAARLNILTRYVDKLDVQITQRVNVPFDSFKTLIVSEFWRDAEDALALHYVDGLVDVTTDAKPAKTLLEELTKGSRELKRSIRFMWGGEENVK